VPPEAHGWFWCLLFPPQNWECPGCEP
jgi:hypothetical protein